MIFTLTGGTPGTLQLNSISPTTVGATARLTARGGVPPYTFAFTTNATGGTLSAAGDYTAGPTPGTDVVHVTDSVPATAGTSIQVNPALFVTITGPTDGAQLASGTVQVSAHSNAGPGYSIEIWADAVPRQMGPTNASGNVTLQVMLGNGAHQLQARMSSPTAVQSAFVNVVVDTVPPAISIGQPLAGDTVASPFTVSGTTEPNRPVDVKLDGMLAGSTISDGTGAWSVPIMQSITPGAHTLGAATTDLAGNPGTTQIGVQG